MEHINRVRGFIVDNFLFGDGTKLKDDTSFMSSGIIDSTGMLEVITFLEESYGINIHDHELVPANLDSVVSITKFLEQKISCAG